MDDTSCQAEIRISWSKTTVTVRWPEVFRAPRPGAAEQFVQSALQIDEVRGIFVDGEAGTASVELTSRAAIAETLRRLSLATKGGAAADADFDPAALKRMRQPRFRLFRHDGNVSSWDILHEQPGRIRFRHDLLRSDPLLPRRIDAALEGVQGVEEAVSRPVTGTLLIHFNPNSIDRSHLLRILDGALEELEPESNALHPSEIRFGLANTSLALAAAGEFAVPALLPASAVLLLISNSGNFRDAWRQLRRRRMGLPLLYSAIVVGTLGTGQFLVAASMSWLIKFWHRQYAWRLAAARRRLFEPLMRRQPFVNVVDGGGVKILPIAELTHGQIMLAAAGEKLPIGGSVLGGYALVDESLVRGSEGLVPKALGDEVFAASTVVVGKLEVKVERCGDETRVAALSEAMAAALAPPRGELAPSTHGERFAQRAVAPTLATAGVGLLVGDIGTAATILRPDYATGPGLAVPLETLASVFACAQHGIVVRDATALDRLAEADLILFEGREVLARTSLEVAEITCHSDLTEQELLRFAATALAGIDDDRAQAVLDACRHRGVAWRERAQLDVGPGITIYEGGKRISVVDDQRARDRLSVERARTAAMSIVMDGAPVGKIAFRISSRRPGQQAIEQLQAAGAPELGLFFDRSRLDEICWLAELEVDARISATSADEKAAFLRQCREDGRKVALVGHAGMDEQLQKDAYVSVALADDESWQKATAPLVLLQPRLSKLVALWSVAHSRRREVGVAHRYALVPNLFCVAGAFFFGFTSLAAVALTNVGTLASFRRVNRHLRSLEAPEKAEAKERGSNGAARHSHPSGQSENAADTVHRIEHLPKEVGALLISVGVAGMMLPGLIGAPALVAGGLVLWPGTFGKVEDWLERRYPEMHRKGVKQMVRYLTDMGKRYPAAMSTTEAMDDRGNKRRM